MADAESQALVRRLFAELNRRNLAAIEELCVPDGAAAVRESAVRSFAAFPDLQGTIDELIAAGDTVVVCATFRGTHRGELASPLGRVPSTGRSAVWTGIDVCRVVDGRLAVVRGERDRVGLLHQLGATLAPAAVTVPDNGGSRAG